MLNFILSVALVGVGASGSSDGSRSLSDSGTLGGVEAAGTPVKGSKMLFTTKPVTEGSATAFLIKNIVALENVVQGVAENNDKTEYDITVKMDNGETRVITQNKIGRIKVGTRVKIKDGKVWLRQ